MSQENVSNSNDHHERDDHKRRPRKKRKNFLANAKKYAKKGQMGRGTKISEELYQYFVGILDAMKQGIQDKDERSALVNNVLERTKGEEQNVVGNQLGCRVVELLLPFASPEDLERYMEVLSPDLRRLCSDNFTSHVVETLLRAACERATEHLQTSEDQTSDSEEEAPKKKKPKLEPKTEKKYTEDHIKKCYEFTIKISKYALNNLEDFVWDQYANHILRSVLKCLSGITLLPGEKPKVNIFKDTVDDGKGIPPHTGKMVYKNVPDEFKEIVKEFVHRLTSWPQFKDLPYQNITSGLVQVLLYAIKNVDKNATKDLLRKLLDESFAPEDWVNNGEDDKKEVKDSNGVVVDTSNLPPVFESEPAVRQVKMLEAALFVSKKKTYTQIYARCFINRLGQLASMPMLNYTVQRLIDNCEVKEEVDRMGALLACGNTGVLVALAKACLRLKAKQAQYLNSLEAALDCSSPEHQKYFPVLCLRLLPRDRVDLAALDKDYFIHVHGSVILQTVLDFQRPAKAVSGLLELTGDQLMIILCDAKGCHVADAFCKGQFVGVKARDKLIWRLKYGSRAFEQVFQVASLEQKIKIMTELSDKSNLLNSTQYGRLVASKLEVDTFKLSQKKWEETWKKKEVQNK
ncbi:hypothetical protein HW555_009922 [Spodoptera exigua]|uniref:Nucleolar protein 9 n=1 Tax=Spodoptera exigua TaxID=7107 RepID=A0A835GBF0_SPOEX|nr:hypothetical protein HW555_009922 [Spodoptera exigua]